MGGWSCRRFALVGVCALVLALCSGTTGAAAQARAEAGQQDEIVVIPQNWHEAYPFSLRFADTEGAEHVIDLAAARFATDRLVTLSGRRTFREPDLATFPASNVRQPFAAGRRDLFIVQATDPKAQVVLRRWLERVRVPVLGYVPDEAYLVRLDQRTLALLSAQEAVFWIGLFQPAYRVAPDLDFILEANPGHPLKLRLRLDLEGYPSEADVRAMLGSVSDAVVVDVARTHRDWIARVDGPVELARAFAAHPGVLWVERFVDFELHNNVARTSSSVATGRGAAAGPIMDVEDVWARGIHGEGQIASAADTGLSTGDRTTAGSLHWDFGQVGSTTNPMRVIQAYPLGRSTWDDPNPAPLLGGHGTHTSGSIVGNGIRSGSTPSTNTFPASSFAGIAPKAQFVFQSVLDSSGRLGGIPLDLNVLFQQTYDDGARVHSNSWGSPAAGVYTTDSENLDEFVWNHPQMVVTFSAGNAGTDATGKDGVINTDSIDSPGTAKNCITVGASENFRPDFIYEVPEGDCTGTAFTQAAWGWFNSTKFPSAPINADLMANNASGMAAFSSRGPTDDTRNKPDITAPGVAVISTRTNQEQGYEQWGTCNVPAAQRQDYLTMGGTSMANPLTAGAATLVRQYYEAGWHANGSDVTNLAPVPANAFSPSAALVKATLINGAWDMAPGQYGTTPTPQPEIPPSWDRAVPRDLPNNAEGYGRVDLEASLFPNAGWGRDASRSVHVRDVTAGIGTGGRNSLSYEVKSNTDPLIVTLAWTDPYGLPAVGTKLVNNLDLEVTSPTGRRYHTNRVNAFVPSTSPFVRDSRNNVEQVKVTAPQVGWWTIEVAGTNVPGNGVAGTDSQPFAVVISTIACAAPGAPPSVSAVASGNNRIQLGWSNAPGVTEYRVYRGLASGAATTYMGTVAAGASYADTTVEAGLRYFYVVKSVNPPACETASLEVSAVADGVCTLAPEFAGLASVTSSATASCGLDLSWGATSASCGGPVRYSVYRSTTTGFTPDASNRIATGLATTTFTDSGALTFGTTYHYVVRATDEGNGVEETNAIERSATPTSGTANQPLYGPETFEAIADGSLAGWTRASFTGNELDWRGVQTCTANSGAKVFRYGGATCAGKYANGNHAIAWPPGIAVPAGSTTVRLSFWHRWNFQAANDGAYLRISTDGSNFMYVRAAAILSNPYNDTAAGLAVWSGDAGTFGNTIVDLDAACNMIYGNTGGCAGKTVYVGFTVYTSANVNDVGWFIDDVAITADVPGSCGVVPQPVPFFTARSASGANLLEWQNPLSGPYGSAILRVSDVTFPTSISEGAGWTCPETENKGAGDHNACTHPGLTDGQDYYYSLFVDSGGVYSSRRSVAAKPFATSGAHKWSYSTGAASLAPAGILPGAIGTGGVFAVSNDRVLHAMEPEDGGGRWPRTGSFLWTPAAMNGPAQHRPPVVPTATGLRVFLASQDGYAYAVDATDGHVIWTSARLGDVLQANPAGFFSNLWPVAPDMLFVGTRNATSGNTLYALDPETGATLASFDNGGGASAIGIITGITVDYATSNVYFTSRASGSGSSDTLWCLHASRVVAPPSASLTPVSSLPLGDIDGGPVLYQSKIYVGTNTGLVRAIDVSDPAVPVPGWSYATSDGPVKGYVYPHFGSTPVRLYFATNTKVWAVDEGSTPPASVWSVGTVPNPSTPLYVSGAGSLLVGGGNGTLYELGTDGSLKGSLSLGTSALGSPARDAVNERFYVGSTAGVVHAVAVPLQ